MEIDLKLLQFAVVLALRRHFGRAAAELQISQPTLSRSIAALEKELGVRIFERPRRPGGRQAVRERGVCRVTGEQPFAQSTWREIVR